MKKNKKNGQIKFIIELIVLIFFTHLFFTQIVRPISVIGTSMYPTVFDKDIALINVIGLKTNGVERFDVVVLKSGEGENIIKRVIGLPGETIKYEDDVLYINGVKYDEPFLDPVYVEGAKKKYNSSLFTNNFEVTVPEGEYFVLGDNRLNSKDSRYFGAFKLDDFIGKDGIIVYPFNHFKWLSK